MDLASHPGTQPRVHELVALDRALALELGRDDDGLEMSIVIGLHADLGTGQASMDQLGDFVGRYGGVAGRIQPSSLKEKACRL